MKGSNHLEVSASHVVMACYNMMIPHIVTDLPTLQAEALSQQMKSPPIYTTVGLRHWRAFKEQGIGLAMCPGNMHQTLFMDFPVSMGGYQYTQKPDDPCVVQMISCPYSDEVGKPRGSNTKRHAIACWGGNSQIMKPKFESISAACFHRNTLILTETWQASR